MDSNLNNFFVTFKIYKDGKLNHSIECPRSLVQQMFFTWVYPETPYVVKVVDHDGIVRIDSSVYYN